MKIIGIDPSLNGTGIAILNEKKKVIRLLRIGIKKLRGPERLIFIRNKLSEVLDEVGVNMAIIERPAFGAAGMLASIGELYGIIKVLLYERGIPFNEVSPMTVKKAVAGTGRAEKEDVLKSIKKITKLKENISFDEADAVALALYGIQKNNVKPQGERE